MKVRRMMAQFLCFSGLDTRILCNCTEIGPEGAKTLMPGKKSLIQGLGQT